MRFLFIVAMVVATAHGIRANGVEFVRVRPNWQDADSFERISEYFTGRENTGSEIVVRTHAEARAGYYYLVRAKNTGVAIAGAKFVVQLVAPDSPAIKTFTFPVELAAGTFVFELGLTGADWPGKKTHPVAWKLELVDAGGTTLAIAKSFLWEKPAK